jgi:hypothetical protein
VFDRSSGRRDSGIGKRFRAGIVNIVADGGRFGKFSSVPTRSRSTRAKNASTSNPTSRPPPRKPAARAPIIGADSVEEEGSLITIRRCVSRAGIVGLRFEERPEDQQKREDDCGPKNQRMADQRPIREVGFLSDLVISYSSS